MARQEPNRRKLTDLSVARIKPPATGNVIVWDTLLPAFGVRVSHTGRRVWIAAVRRPGQQHPVRLKLDPQPEGVADARKLARAMMEHGGPPAPVLFSDLTEAFLAHGRTKKGKLWRPATARVYRDILRGPAAPLHHLPVSRIRRKDISALTSTIAVETGGTTASLTRAVLGRFWQWLGETDQADANPVVSSPSYEVARRTRTLSPAEIAMLWRATERLDDFSMIVRILLWTGCRRAEAGGMRASELSPDGTLWTLPPERTKNHTALELPIPRQMQAALTAWPRNSGRDHLFGILSPHGLARWAQHKADLDARLEFDRPWILHDCRRTVETGLAELRVPKNIANKLLNHGEPTVTKSYDHYSYRSEKAEALQRWADQLSTMGAQPGR